MKAQLLLLFLLSFFPVNGLRRYSLLVSLVAFSVSTFALTLIIKYKRNTTHSNDGDGKGKQDRKRRSTFNTLLRLRNKKNRKTTTNDATNWSAKVLRS